MEGHSGRPAPKYTKVGERLRHVIPGHMACSMACGGKACKYENPSRWSEREQAIRGLYSSWVTENILATARPSTELLEKYCILEQFRSHGIKTVINLQRPGEHASCGYPLEQESGFTYLPEAFMETGIYFYNFGWKDYGVASLTTILDMVKVMTFALQEGKVAVHCHAGLGRTGVLIACYLVFATRMTADQAIIFVRAKRPNSIQTRGQLLCIREFTQFLIPLRNVFSCCDPKAHAVTLAQYLTRQRHLLHGREARLLRHVPKLVHLVCRLLLDLAEDRLAGTDAVAAAPSLSAEIEKTVSEVVTRHRAQELLGRHSDMPDSRVPSLETTAGETQGLALPSEPELDPLWKRRNAERLRPLTCLRRWLSSSDSDLKRAEGLLEQGVPPWTAPAQALRASDSRRQKPPSPCCTPQTPHADSCKETWAHDSFSFWNQAKRDGTGGLRGDRSPASSRESHAKEVQRSRTFSAGMSCSFSLQGPATPNCANFEKEPDRPHQQVLPSAGETQGRAAGCSAEGGGARPVPADSACCSAAQVSAGAASQGSEEPSEQSAWSAAARRILAAKALANLNESAEEEEEVRRKVERWQKELNFQDGAWERVRGEKDPFTLCSLMWSWVEQLKEPVITREDVDMLVRARAEAAEALFLLEKGQHQTILCVLHCLASLRALPADVEEAVLAQSIKAFTKVSSDSENGPVVYNTLKKIFKHALEEKRKMMKGSPGPGV